jgi:cyclic dehypoxanthinyl futalosine synthase
MAVVESTRTVSEILDHVLDGERLSDADALTLMRSRDLVAIGAAANEIRNRKANPGEVTYIVDRNINYTNVCVTDCNFCAFYRQPGDTREGYVLPKQVIFAKIEETIAVEIRDGDAGTEALGKQRGATRARLVNEVDA